ncbi:CBM96 family carbohydrate-binding protein [Paenibacillus roseipurpureus]|uniref:DNRLRE domain-containing protein n=1 Tax=Paenibacillus roseopurpureus TaxID=2918901 RepID=A0AA96LJI0_9BACL|nr:DNRLRE domain-containing protein [Paenibacillus sp. MBLB1832]WNR42885.1 DNRLRE domain-containing protein [Paenibacillus sp. MBLB1832]
MTKINFLKFVSALSFMFGIFLFVAVVHAHAQDYYVNSVTGSNANAGTSTGSAWADFTNVNNTTFLPGDRILLARGSSWNSMLNPKGSGNSTSRIIIDAYGSGAAPKVNGNAATAGVYLKNQQYWTVQNLEVTNTSGYKSNRRGILVENTDAGTLNSIYILNNNVHDIAGDNSKDLNSSEGIFFVVKGSTVQSNYNDILIDGNTVGPAVDRGGISISSSWYCRADAHCTGTTNWYPSTNVKISNNYLSDIGGDGIVPCETVGAVVEYNVVNGFNIRSGQANAGIWTWDADDTIIQYNEASGGKTTFDSEGYDLDYGQTGTIIQYNYSHDNEGGFLLECNCSYPSVGKNEIVRYNISQNDQTRLFMFSGGSSNLQVYNNTLYLKSGMTTNPFAGSAYEGTAYFKNNIFYLLGAGDWVGPSTFATLVFDSNTFYGVHTTGEPSDAHKSTADPKLTGPGLGVSRTNVDGYKLMAGSPALNSGVTISNNNGKDYYGNAVSNVAVPNRGAYNGMGNIVLNPGFESGSASWSLWGGGSLASIGANSGANAVKVAGSDGGAEQTITVAPNKTYRLLARGRVDIAGDSIKAGVKNYGGTEKAVAFTSQSYVQGGLTFTTGSSNTTAIVYFYKPAGSGIGYGDDLYVEEVPAVTQSWTASDDSTVRDGSYADTNMSGTSATSLETKLDIPGWDRDSYLKFDFSAYTGTISKAVITLNPLTADTAGVQNQVAIVSDTSWSEGTITWNTKPSSGTILGTYTIAAGTPVVVDVTSQVQAAMQTGKKISIRVYTSSAGGSGTNVTYASSENASINLRPTMTITP